MSTQRGEKVIQPRGGRGEKSRRQRLRFIEEEDNVKGNRGPKKKKRKSEKTR